MKIGRTWLVPTFAVFVAVGGSGSALAQDAEAQATLEEIVVTARRREETLQDLPLSIAVVAANDLTTQGIYTSNQVAELVPNLSLKEDTPGSSLVFIRGIGGGHSNPSFSFGAGMYIDGHYIPYARGGYMSTLDIDRIEVLRGPQGTLFGKNTTGGALSIISTKPQPEFDSSVTARVGDFGQQDLRGMVNFPISDNLYARLSAASEEFDGYYFNRRLNRDAGYRDMTAWRAALRWLPGNWTIDAVVSNEKSDNESRVASCAPDPAGPFGLAAWGVGDPGQVRTYAECAESAAMGPYTTATDTETYTNFDTRTANLTAEWNSDGPVGALESLAVRTTYSWREMQNPWFNESDYTSFPYAYFRVTGPDGTGTVSENTSFEVLFEGDVNERLDFLLGYWTFDNLTDDAQGPDCRSHFLDTYDPVTNPVVTCPREYVGFGPFIGLWPGAPPGFPIRPGAIQSALDEQSEAVFGHLTYAINDLWDLEFGVRYTVDDRDWYNWRTIVSNVNQTPGVYPATYDVIMDSQSLCNFEDPTQPARGWCGQDFRTWSATTPKLSLMRSLDGIGSIDSGNLYFLYSEGYLSGAFNSNRPVGTEVFWTIDPEYVSNYEVGFKGIFSGGRLSLNADVFFMKYTDKQAEIVLDNSDQRFANSAGTLEVLTNAATADIYGFELEMAALPWDGGVLRVDLGYLNNTYGHFETFDPDRGGNVDLSSTSILDLSADWTLNASLQHTFQLGNGGSISPMLGMYWQSDYDWLPPARPGADPHKGFCLQDSYSKLRARLSYESPGGNYGVSLYGRNISDEEILANCGFSWGIGLKTLEAPATWGLEFNARWGE